MSIYKVRVAKDGNSVSYTAFSNTTLIIIVPSGDKYELTTMDNYSYKYDTLEEAMQAAEQKITRFFATLGIQPKFIND